MGKGYNNYMCKKPFHPGSKANIKRAWMAEQKTENEKKKQEELKVQYEKEQELYNNRALLSTESKDKLELNFMYEAPPGAKRERQKEDDEPEFKFEWQRKYNAPREDYAKGNADIKDQPFGIPVRNVRCIKCHKWGHINTDKECPLFAQASTSSMPTTSMDPMELMRQMREDGYGLKENVLGHQLSKAANQQLIPSDESDPEMEFLKSLSASDKKKLLRKLKKLSKRQEKKSNCKKKKSKKTGKSKSKDKTSDSDRKKKKSKKSKETSSSDDSGSDSSSEDSSVEKKRKKHSKKSHPNKKSKKKRDSSQSSSSESESDEPQKHKKSKDNISKRESDKKHCEKSVSEPLIKKRGVSNENQPEIKQKKKYSQSKELSDMHEDRSKNKDAYKVDNKDSANLNYAPQKDKGSFPERPPSKTRTDDTSHSSSDSPRHKTLSSKKDSKTSKSEVAQSNKHVSKTDKNKSTTAENSKTCKSVEIPESCGEEKEEGKILKRKAEKEQRQTKKNDNECEILKKQKSDNPEHPDGFSHVCPQARVEANYFQTSEEYQGEGHDEFRHFNRERRSPSVKQKYH